MVKRAISYGVKADYLLMDSWFCWPSILAQLGTHLPVICMGKNMPKVLYRHQDQWVTLGKLYTRLRKRPGRARILASVVVQTKNEQDVKVVFVRTIIKETGWLSFPPKQIWVLMKSFVSMASDGISRCFSRCWSTTWIWKEKRNCGIMMELSVIQPSQWHAILSFLLSNDVILIRKHCWLIFRLQQRGQRLVDRATKEWARG